MLLSWKERWKINFHLLFSFFFSFDFSLLLYSTRGSLFIQWFVSSISKDIADFYLHFRDGKSRVLFEKIIAYNTRIVNVTSVEMEEAKIDFERSVDVCILAQTSDGVILHFDASQCVRMPSDFNSLMKKYNKRPSTFFKIYEMDKKHLGRNAIALKSAATTNFKLHESFKLFIIALSISILTL